MVEDSRTVKTTPLEWGESVVAIDAKGHRYYFTLQEKSALQTHHGHTPHTEFVGVTEGSIVTNNKGYDYVVFRPTWAETGVNMPRGAAVVYPKDAAAIVLAGDIKPGAVVVEVAAGSGALSSYLLRAVGETGRVISYEARDDFAEIARKNVTRALGREPTNWQLIVESVSAGTQLPSCEVGVLDLLKPWELLPALASAVIAGGRLVAYVTTTTQMSELIEEVRHSGDWFEPSAHEVFWRDWHVAGLSVRPSHSFESHTGFIVTTRRMAEGVIAPKHQGRKNKGAYQSKPSRGINTSK